MKRGMRWQMTGGGKWNKAERGARAIYKYTKLILFSLHLDRSASIYLLMVMKLVRLWDNTEYLIHPKG